MHQYLKRALFWAPRILAIAFTAFVSLFALDAFEGRGFWAGLPALSIHLIPTYILVAMLVLAWRWEWIGTVVCGGLGTLFLWWDRNYRHNVTADVLLIAGPLFLIAALFLLNWLKHAELRK